MVIFCLILCTTISYTFIQNSFSTSNTNVQLCKFQMQEIGQFHFLCRPIQPLCSVRFDSHMRILKKKKNYLINKDLKYHIMADQ
jgi:hypothetical protein